MITMSEVSRLLFGARRGSSSTSGDPELTFLKDGTATPNEQNTDYNTMIAVSVIIIFKISEHNNH
jgi:hypothetical protein